MGARSVAGRGRGWSGASWEYVTLTTPRRQVSRVVGIGFFSLMTICFMGPGACAGRLINNGLTPAVANYLETITEQAILGSVPKVDGAAGAEIARPKFTGTDGSQTGIGELSRGTSRRSTSRTATTFSWRGCRTVR